MALSRVLAVPQVLGEDLQVACFVDDPEFGLVEPPVQRHLGGAVFEGAVLVVFHPDHSGGQDGKPVSVTANDGRFRRGRIGCKPQMRCEALGVEVGFFRCKSHGVGL